MPETLSKSRTAIGFSAVPWIAKRREDAEQREGKAGRMMVREPKMARRD